MTRHLQFTEQHTLYMSPEMLEELQTIARKRNPKVKENDLIREAIRNFLDNEAQGIGSRRHFQKTLQQRVDALESNLLNQTQLVLFYLNVIIQLLSFALAHVISVVSQKKIEPTHLLQKAMADARREESIFARQVDAVRRMEDGT